MIEQHAMARAVPKWNTARRTTERLQKSESFVSETEHMWLHCGSGAGGAPATRNGGNHEWEWECIALPRAASCAGLGWLSSGHLGKAF